MELTGWLLIVWAHTGFFYCSANYYVHPGDYVFVSVYQHIYSISLQRRCVYLFGKFGLTLDTTLFDFFCSQLCDKLLHVCTQFPPKTSPWVGKSPHTTPTPFGASFHVPSAQGPSPKSWHRQCVQLECRAYKVKDGDKTENNIGLHILFDTLGSLARCYPSR